MNEYCLNTYKETSEEIIYNEFIYSLSKYIGSITDMTGDEWYTYKVLVKKDENNTIIICKSEIVKTDKKKPARG